MQEHRNALQPGYSLHWYKIRSILGQGGFGITYLAEDPNLDQLVAIKEYLPMELAVRQQDTRIQPVTGERGEQFAWGLERFIGEAQTLARFKHPNIVRVLAVFRENNTAYMVMEYEQGQPLHEILKERKTLPEKELKALLAPLLNGLEAVHAAGFIHRDIKPPNIYLREDGSPVLLDFGSARQSLGEQTHTLTAMVSPGYAPFEQYHGRSDKQGPWTDIYGLSATLYRAITGIGPMDAMDRSEALLHSERDTYVPAREIAFENYSVPFLAAIDHGMAFKPEDRPQTITTWRRELSAEGDEILPTAAPLTALEQETVKADSKVADENATTVAAAGVATPSLPERFISVVKKLIKWLLVLLVLLIILAILRNVGDEKQTAETEMQPEEPAEITGAPDEPALPVPEEAVPEPVPEPPAVSAPEPDDANQARIAPLLDAAERHRAALRLTTPAGNNALENYQQVLALEPGNREALAGIDRIVDDYIQLMDQSLAQTRIADAEEYLDRATRVNPDHHAIPAARERLATQTERLRSREDAITREKEQDTVTGKSRIPEEDREAFRKARERILKNPDSSRARREMRKLAERIEEKIRRAVEKNDYELAEDYVEEILQYAPDDGGQRPQLERLLESIRNRNMQFKE